MLRKGKIIIGRRDIADFPQLELEGISVKTDSGAYTSSFHCHQIEFFKQGAAEWVRCRFLDPLHPKYHQKEFTFEVFKNRKVKSSNGQVEDRLSIKTIIELFNIHYPIELTLTERADMRHPVLLGRKFLSKNFLIDTSRINLSARGQIMKVKLIS